LHSSARKRAAAENSADQCGAEADEAATDASRSARRLVTSKGTVILGQISFNPIMKLPGLQHGAAGDLDAAGALRGHVPGVRQDQEQLRLAQLQRDLLPDLLEHVSAALPSKRETDFTADSDSGCYFFSTSKSENVKNEQKPHFKYYLKRHLFYFIFKKCSKTSQKLKLNFLHPKKLTV
jgi:hypothetical protein